MRSLFFGKMLLCAVFAGALVLAAGCGGGSDPEDDLGGTDLMTDSIGGDVEVPDHGPRPDVGGQDVNDVTQDPGSGETIEDTHLLDDGGLSDLAIPDEGQPDAPDAGCDDPDGDGYGPGCGAGPDCAPTDAARHASVEYYIDSDFDGFGAGELHSVCAADGVPPGYSTVNTDCDDGNAAVFPGAPDNPDDNKTNDCGGQDIKAATADGIFVKPGNPDTNTGTRESPVGKLSAAVSLAQSGGKSHVFVATGTISDSVTIAANVSIHGGYDSTTWTRAALKSRLVGTIESAVTINGSNVAIDQFEIFATDDPAIANAAESLVAIEINDSTVFLNNVIAGGSAVQTSGADSREIVTAGVQIQSSNVTMNGCRIGDGGPMIGKYSGTGNVDRRITSRAIMLISGNLRMNGGTAGFYPEIELSDIKGTAHAQATSRAILVAGGSAVVAGVDFSGGMDVTIDDGLDDGTNGQATAIGDAAGIEVAGGEAWVINSVIGGGMVKTYVELDTIGTVENPIDAVATARTIAVPVLATGGKLVVAHCDLHTDRFSEAVVEATSSRGQEIVSARNGTALVKVGPTAVAVVINSAGYSQLGLDDSALLVIDPQAALTMINSVWWDMDNAVCRVRGGEACVISEGGLDGLDDVEGVTEAAGNLVADQLWGWWDEVDPGSPLKDGAVDPLTRGLGVFQDFDGKARPQGEAWDIGAYEFN